MRRIIVISSSIVLLLTVAAMAQESRQEISVQGTGFFTNGSSGNGTTYSSTETAGVLGSYRYHLNRWVSAEAVYGYDRDTQKFTVSSGGFRIPANIHQATAGFVFKVPFLAHSRLSPYVLAEGGALVFNPAGGQFNAVAGAQTQAKATFVYGGGFNYAITKRLALRMEYRGLVYDTPNFGFSAISTNSITHTAQPSVGLSYRF